jgi:hypothetical protein
MEPPTSDIPNPTEEEDTVPPPSVVVEEEEEETTEDPAPAAFVESDDGPVVALERVTSPIDPPTPQRRILAPSPPPLVVVEEPTLTERTVPGFGVDVDAPADIGMVTPLRGRTPTAATISTLIEPPSPLSSVRCLNPASGTFVIK